MARPRQAPQRSINRLTTRTERVTPVSYNETKRIRKRDSHDGMMPEPALIKIQMLGRLQHRDLVLRSVAAACKLVNARRGHRVERLPYAGGHGGRRSVQQHRPSQLRGPGRRHRRDGDPDPARSHLHRAARLGRELRSRFGAPARLREPARVGTGNIHHQDAHGDPVHGRATRTCLPCRRACEFGRSNTNTVDGET